MTTKYATHWVHSDAAGMNTAVRAILGAKYWVILYRKTGSNSPFGNLNSIHMFGGGWLPHKPFTADDDDWVAEGVWVTSKEAL
jgi:hypothetical protein